ncbi:hypothetical protein B0T22DRAFT_444399 [Podospora appendiculata]|uniref:Ras-GAP domain-containing protein n=1 Tax=Podospora appendiculata TaxID=314037 RepID=A0AAE0X0H3_9PEZI|nr:hypothetical protein B0T22DRAFT_444399 [Podospora appendiculata]
MASVAAVAMSRGSGSGSGSGSGGGVGGRSGGGIDRLSTSNMRTAFRPGTSVNLQHQTVRAVTPEPADVALDALEGKGPRGFASLSPQTSPRSIPGVQGRAAAAAAAAAAAPGSLPAKRQPTFHDSFAGSFDSTLSSPPPRQPSFRPRTHTMDGAFRQQLAPAQEPRNRMGSFSSSGSLPVNEELRHPPLQPPYESYRPPDPPAQPTGLPTPKERKSSMAARGRLTKRPSSRPSSPLSSLPPSVDSLPLPIPTTDANKILLLMRNLCGRMRGEVEYQRGIDGPWHVGICYIEEEKGSLMFDSGENGPFHSPLVADLRGCRVRPMDRRDKERHCLEIISPHLNLALILRPLVAEELDLWLAALLCWQQLRPVGPKLPTPRLGNGGPPARAEIKRQDSSAGLRDAAIIKAGQVQLWDKGVATSPRAIVKRPSTRDLRSTQTSWRKVSCILQGNGELKLMTENDLARSAIQQLDKSVLDEDYCIAIFPTYSSTSTQLSIFRPVYIALESRVLLEVWFVLLRAFAIPDVYCFDPLNGGQVYEVVDLASEPVGETFRVERTISVRITEAKVRGRNLLSEGVLAERHGRSAEPDPAVGNYLAEVILDGEVRARTTTKMATKNPFWREDCEFTDLPATMPYLSVLLKRVDGNHESFTHQLQSTLGLPKTGNLSEVLCGAVDIPLHQLDRAKDHEQWFNIYDDRQQSVGTMFVKVQYEELVVFATKTYQPLSELLHRFGTGLTAQITEALPGCLRKVAEILLNIYQVSGTAANWIMDMVEEEIDGIGNQTVMKKPRFSRRLKSNDSIDSISDREQLVRDMGKSLQGEANLLFRGNSLLTQALEFHMRRLGKEYLEDMLADKINEINEMNPNCEVDPGKIQHGEDVQQHWNRLIQLTTEVWGCIASSAARLPSELRHILKYIRAVAEDRYGDFLRTVTYTSVSGFLFLRFICPAILNPKLFGLLRDHPRPRAQRTLTLIAKGLQALANLSTIGKKEMWMDPMNRFLNTQRQSVRDFLDSVCGIPVERTKAILPASYSTPITILGRLSPVAREGFPSLPYLVDHPRNFAALIKLWVDAHPSSADGVQVYTGDLLEFHNLCNSLQGRAAECFARIESLRNAAETASQSADDHHSMTDAMDRVSLAGDILPSSSYNSSAVWMDNELRPPGSSGSDIDAHIKDTRQGSTNSRDAGGSLLRQVSKSSEMLHSSSSSSQQQQPLGGSMRHGLRNGMHPRKFLSGFIRSKTARAPSPDGTGAQQHSHQQGHGHGHGHGNHHHHHQVSPTTGAVAAIAIGRERDQQHHEKDHNTGKDLERDGGRERTRGGIDLASGEPWKNEALPARQKTN